MSEQPKAWTFAALTGRMPPFFMVRRRRRWCEKVLAIKELEGVDISNMTPLDALNTLYRLQSMLKNRWTGE